MARKPTTKPKKLGAADQAAREHAREVADRYFSFGRDDEEGDEELRRRHLDEGYEEGRPTAARRRPGVVPPATTKAPPRLTLKQSMFVKEYLVDLNGTQAAIRAGHSEHTAAQIAYENLRKPHIRALIDHELKERAARAGWDADRVLQRLGQELTADIADLFDDQGRLLPVTLWPMVFRTGLVAGIDMEETTNVDDAGELVPGVVRKIRLSDRLKRLELVGKHVNVSAFKDRVQHDASDKLLEAIAKQVDGTALRPKGGSDGA